MDAYPFIDYLDDLPSEAHGFINGIHEYEYCNLCIRRSGRASPPPPPPCCPLQPQYLPLPPRIVTPPSPTTRYSSYDYPRLPSQERYMDNPFRPRPYDRREEVESYRRPHVSRPPSPVVIVVERPRRSTSLLPCLNRRVEVLQRPAVEPPRLTYARSSSRAPPTGREEVEYLCMETARSRRERSTSRGRRAERWYVR